jgi:hypothetical protein
MDCTRDSSSVTARCSGNGVYCQPDDICICDPGWSALGDYSTFDGADCAIHEKTIEVMCYFDICQSAIFIMIVLRYILTRNLEKKGYKFSNPKNVFPRFFLIFGISDLALSILKVVYHELIGRDIASSIFQTSFSFSCFCGLVSYFQVILQFLKG